MSKTIVLISALTFGLTFSAPPARAENDLIGEVKVARGLRPTDLVIYLANPPAASSSTPPSNAIIDQRNQTFHPHVLAVVRGTKVRFLNSDRVTHNIFSLSSTKAFDLGRIAPKTFSGVTFEKPGIVEVLCAFHTRMLAYIHVFDHPYFAVPDERGYFTIKGVPSGAYEFRVWHERFGAVSKKVNVSSDRSVPIRLRIPN